uniref:Uncharacterized protein n=1 Tax=Mycena chlorophos TaxID=658473 RepID=A0ABQ0KX87_MYCCL|nr:predicted protein [Mycena chlorophos]
MEHLVRLVFNHVPPLLGALDEPRRAVLPNQGEILRAQSLLREREGQGPRASEHDAERVVPRVRAVWRGGKVGDERVLAHVLPGVCGHVEGKWAGVGVEGEAGRTLGIKGQVVDAHNALKALVFSQNPFLHTSSPSVALKHTPPVATFGEKCRCRPPRWRPANSQR